MPPNRFNADAQDPPPEPLQKPRLRDTDPEGMYSGSSLRNAIQGDGFTPRHEEIYGDPSPKKSKVRQTR